MSRIRSIANKGLLQIFSALLFVAVLMFASNYMVYKNSINGIYTQVSQKNNLIVKNIIRDFDKTFKDINNIIFTIQMLPYNAWEASGTGNIDMNDAYMTLSNLRSMISSIDYIEEVIVFHQGSDLAITPSGTILLQELFRLKYDHPVYHVDYWKSFANTRHPLQVFPSQAYVESSSAGTVERKLIPVLGSNQHSNLNVLVLINYDKLMRHVNQDAMMQGSSLIVMDDNRNVILNTGDHWNIIDMLYELNPNADSEATLKQQDYEYNVFKSSLNGFIYINKSPYQFKDLQAVTSVNRQIMAIAVISAIILSALLSMYLYKPVRHLVYLIGGRDQKGADYRNIRASIVKMKEENEFIKTQMDAYAAEMRQMALLGAIHGTSPARETERRMQLFVPEFYLDKYFVLAAFQLQVHAQDEQASSVMEEFSSSLDIELSSRFSQTILFRIEPDVYMAVISFGKHSDREQTLNQVRNMVEQLRKKARESAEMVVAISRAYRSESSQCQLAYRDVTAAFEHQNMDSGDRVIDFNSIRYTWKVYAPLDEIKKLSQFLMMGNVEEGLRIVQEIWAENEARRVHRHQLITVAKTCFYDMVKHLEASELDAKQIIALEHTFLEELNAAAGPTGIREVLIRTVRFVAETCGRFSQKSKLDRARIVQYIEQHYMDDLHLEHMAGQLETTPKYFSNYFKKAFGVNFVEYVNKIRLSHAEELLKMTELSVAEIGKRTGYESSSRFTNTFRKYYGISPSEYRKSSQTDMIPPGAKK